MLIGIQSLEKSFDNFKSMYVFQKVISDFSIVLYSNKVAGILYYSNHYLFRIICLLSYVIHFFLFCFI